MNNSRKLIQQSLIIAYEGPTEIGTTTKSEVENFSNNTTIDFPLTFNEQNQECINILQLYFEII